MIQRVIEWSIKNKALILLIYLLFAFTGLWALMTIPIDAIPDLSDTQVIIYTEYKGQSPRTIEDQITYPLTTALLSVPGARVVRGYSFFGYSLVYVIFKDGINIYWARSRVLEYLNYAQKRLPSGVFPMIGPDATGIGWVYEYALISKKRSLQELRSYQDWYLKYGLSSVEGVAEVASIGGYVKQYQIVVNPFKLQAYKISLRDLEMAIKNANLDIGGEVIQMAEAEYMIRGVGYIKSEKDIRNIPVKSSFQNGSVVRVGDVADVSTGPEIRRGIADLDGKGEVVGGIVVIRQGENARSVIVKIKKKLEVLKQGLPSDIEIIPTYDRSELISRAITNLKNKIFEEFLIVTIVCIIFLFHVRSAFIAIFTLPLAILIAFLVMRLQGINANIMSLGGIAIAIGAMVDGAIIMIENVHKNLELEVSKPLNERLPHWETIIKSSKEVGPAIFWSLLVITVSFIPIFALEAQEGRLFKPLAFTKTYSMAAASIMAITIVPVLIGIFVRGKIPKEFNNPINHFLFKIYQPLVKFTISHSYLIIFLALIIVFITIFPFIRLGSEFMPPLYEGDLLYMPVTMPGVSIAKIREILQQTDKTIASFPEVKRVFGKAGRAETPTDPAGLDMLETTIMLKPKKEWPKGMTLDKLIENLDQALVLPGISNAWTMPIKARIDMLSTGIRTPIGIKVSGPNLDTLEMIGKIVENTLRKLPYTTSAFAERILGGNYIEININREKCNFYGLNIEDVQSTIETAIGGKNVTTTIEGLQRYNINLRYMREFRDNIEEFKNIIINTNNNQLQIPLGQVAEFNIIKGPMVIRTEDSRPNVWIFVDMRGIDIGTYIKKAQKIIANQIILPPGYNLIWSGQFEYMLRIKKRLLMIVPLTLLLIFIILYLNTKSVIKTAIVMLAVPFSLVGAIWLLYLLGYHLSIAVWVGLIALAGLDAETGVVMLLYLDNALNKLMKNGNISLNLLKEAINYGAVKRLRPKIMTSSVIIVGLLPIMWGEEAGSDVIKRIAAPMIGGITTSVIMELLVYPAIYFLWKKRQFNINR